MATDLKKVAEEAMALPGNERAELADLLVQSLSDAELTDIDQVWAKVANRRLGEVNQGAVEAIPGDQALRKVRDLISG